MGLKMALGLYIKRFNETFDLYSINVFCPVQDCEIQHNQAEVSNTTVELPPRQRVLGYDSGRIWPWLGVCDAISTRSMRFQLILQLAKRYY